ncbi:chromosome replication/partitioning protein (plasmid) [Borrelia miyamotoi]|uniref:Chromosome replication/partitioning protein n=1 Tax=Borrelia miyamotoi TaxID=47466 RepID=A0A5P8AUM9_9SPIR|nr:chromosome replication/partitioning protein [Borrelia miyamotoi]QFP42572.1 chromosome replication/partitioning protein [Borrelia miyamotoi]WAZ72934.1 chromosome replication/partitioning protein [Borrelia miyamotoi]WVI05744.1 chromosome replication/partitioning protein [Borrelia miyamotoi]
MKIELNKRVLVDEEDPDDQKPFSTNEEKILYYNTLKERLKANFRKEIFHKIDSIRILKEIKDNEYYKLDGYKSFDRFIKSYRLAKSQVYVYLKIANAMEEGLVEEQYIIENGIHDALNYIQIKESPKIKKSKQNPIKPLRFQLKSQESYAFYKKNAKLTGFILDRLFAYKKDLLNEFINEFKNFEK